MSEPIEPSTSRRPKIVVVGSANADLVARAARLPMPGETVTGSTFAMIPGGKSANQAVTAARLNAETVFVGRVGDDVFGKSLEDSFHISGVDTQFLVQDSSAPTGTALIGVSEASGENFIIVIPGANGNVSCADVRAAAAAIESADAVVLSLEIPLDAVETALEIADAANVRTVLNPAPARDLPDSLLSLCTIITPNEHEVGLLARSSGDPAVAASNLLDRGVKIVVVTQGAHGAVAFEKGGRQTNVPAFNAGEAVDTTAAGDCYTAALTVALCEDARLEDAMRFAAAAAAISVTRPGAQSSLPTRAEVDGLLSRYVQQEAKGIPKTSNEVFDI